MILSGSAISFALDNGTIDIDPFDHELVNPASYDLRLGPEVAVYTATEQAWDRQSVHKRAPSPKITLDAKREQLLTVVQMSPDGFEVEPGRLYLMHTAERVHTRCFVTQLGGKSSIARLGLVVHLTAGFGDPGFDGQYTLEVTSVAHPVVVYPGMRFCQVWFETMKGEPSDYRQTGNYTRENSRGPVRSASHKQFLK